MRRSLFFALTGILWLASWMTGPSYEMPASAARWLAVLLFSAALLSLAVALPVYGRMVGGIHVVRLATFAGAVVGVMSVTNVFEDGFQIDWFFFVFALGLVIFDIALLALGVVVARTAPDWYRLLAVIPAGTLAAILLPMAFGPTMLITWLIAAVVARKVPMRAAWAFAEPATT